MKKRWVLFYVFCLVLMIATSAYAATWQTYDALSVGNLADGDDFLIRDVSDTPPAAGTIKSYFFSSLRTDILGYDNELSALMGLTSAADKLPYFTGSATASTTDFTSFARTLLDDANEAALKTTINAEAGVDFEEYRANRILFSACIPNPDSGYDDIKIRMPFATTVNSVHGHCVGGTNMIVGFYEVDSDADDSDAVQLDSGDYTITTSLFEDLSITVNSTLNANDWLQMDTISVSGSPTMCCITVWGQAT